MVSPLPWLFPSQYRGGLPLGSAHVHHERHRERRAANARVAVQGADNCQGRGVLSWSIVQYIGSTSCCSTLSYRTVGDAVPRSTGIMQVTVPTLGYGLTDPETRRFRVILSQDHQYDTLLYTSTILFYILLHNLSGKQEEEANPRPCFPAK
jgi:hypothetical protein